MMSTREQVDALLEIIRISAHSALGEYETRGTPAPALHSLFPHPLDTDLNTVVFKKIMRNLEGACEQLCSTLALPAHTIANRAQNQERACLRFVTQSRIADVLAIHPEGLHVRDLAQVVQMGQDKLSTILRLLSAKHCFREVDTNVFANNRLSSVLLSSQPMSSFVELMTDDPQKAAYNLFSTLSNQDYAFSVDPSKSPFMHFQENTCGVSNLTTPHSTNKGNVLAKAMVAMDSVIGALSILKEYPWDTMHTVCDVGAGIGSFAWPLLQTYPEIYITLLDLPEVIDQAKEVCEKDYPEILKSDHVTFVGGDFFKEIPSKGADVYYIRNTIQNWPEEQTLAILSNIRKAMSPTSRLLIHDFVIQPSCRLPRITLKQDTENDIAPEPLLPNFGGGKIRLNNQDLTMLVMFNSRERTLTELVGLGEKTDLRLENLWDLGETTVLEFHPKSTN